MTQQSGYDPAREWHDDPPEAAMKALVIYNAGTDAEIMCIVVCKDDEERARAKASVKEWEATAPNPESWPPDEIWDWLQARGFTIAEDEGLWLN